MSKKELNWSRFLLLEQLAGGPWICHFLGTCKSTPRELIACSVSSLERHLHRPILKRSLNGLCGRCSVTKYY